MDMDDIFDLSQEDLDALKSLFESSTGTSSEQDDRTRIRIDEDKMTVWIYLVPPKKGEEYKVGDVVDMLVHNGVSFGHIMPRINALVKKGVYNREVLVARGQKMEEGTDGYYEYFFDTEVNNGKPKIREDGSVDYTAINNVTNIKKGDKIAIYHPAIPGKDGILVDGTVSKTPMVKEKPPLRGRAVIKDENTYYANETGKIELNEGNIDIRNVHEIPGDVDFNTGRVEFWGDITINGNVGAGAYIRCGRNLIINGVVEAATIFSGGDIILKRGIQGNMQANIKCRGNLMSNFLEQCTVEAEGYVDANYILNSNVTSSKKVRVQGSRGSVIGGISSGLLGVEVSDLGNESEVKTIIHAGYSRENYDHWIKLRAEEAEIEVELKDVIAQMEELLKRRRFQGAASTKNLVELNKRQKQLFSRLDDVKGEIEECKSRLDQGRGVKIDALGTVHRGVVLEIENVARPVYQSIYKTQFKSQEGVIVGVPIL